MTTRRDFLKVGTILAGGTVLVGHKIVLFKQSDGSNSLREDPNTPIFRRDYTITWTGDYHERKGDLNEVEYGEALCRRHLTQDLERARYKPLKGFPIWRETTPLGNDSRTFSLICEAKKI